MTTIKTKMGQVLNYGEKEVLHFEDGIIGYEQYKKYIAIPTSTKPFLYLQSIDDEDIAFLIIDPFIICNEYEPDINDEYLASVEFENAKDILLMSIVTIRNDGTYTANLAGPILINQKNNKCLQAILSDSAWPIRYDFTDLMKNGEKLC